MPLSTTNGQFEGQSRLTPAKEHKAAGTPNCYGGDFVTGDVSTRDYFQLPTSGQAMIAAATWNVGAHVSILPSMESTGSVDILKLGQRRRMGVTDAKDRSSLCDGQKRVCRWRGARTSAVPQHRVRSGDVT